MTNLTTLVSTTVELTAAPLCGEVTLDLIPTTLFIDVTPNAVNCTSADFVALIGTKVTGASKWDSAVWDSPESKWALKK